MVWTSLESSSVRRSQIRLDLGAWPAMAPALLGTLRVWWRLSCPERDWNNVVLGHKGTEAVAGPPMSREWQKGVAWHIKKRASTPAKQIFLLPCIFAWCWKDISKLRAEYQLKYSLIHPSFSFFCIFLMLNRLLGFVTVLVSQLPQKKP